MGIPSREYSTTVTGSEVRNVKCERCHAEFAYILSREGTGSDSSVLFLDSQAAEAAALKRATESLAVELKNAVDAVPCPKCGWYQQQMVESLREEWGSPFMYVGAICAATGIFGWITGFVISLAVLWSWVWGRQVTFPKTPVAVCVGGGLALIAVAYLLVKIRRMLAAGIDPNRDHTILEGRQEKSLAVALADATPKDVAAAISHSSDLQQRRLLQQAVSSYRWRAFGALVVAIVASCAPLNVAGQVIQGLRTFGWSTVPGKVTGAFVGSERRGREHYYWPVVTYAYEVAQQPYVGSNYMIEQDDSVSQRSTTQLVSRLLNEPAVNVYYNPEKPADTVLVPGVPFWKAVVFIVPGAISLCFAIGAIVLFIKSVRIAQNPFDLPFAEPSSAVGKDLSSGGTFAEI